MLHRIAPEVSRPGIRPAACDDEYPCRRSARIVIIATCCDNESRFEYPRRAAPEVTDSVDISTQSIVDPAAIGILLTGLLLGVRHGIDWDHIAAITDITSSATSAGHRRSPHTQSSIETLTGDHHDHGGHTRGAGPTTPDRAQRRWRRR